MQSEWKQVEKRSAWTGKRRNILVSGGDLPVSNDVEHTVSSCRNPPCTDAEPVMNSALFPANGSQNVSQNAAGTARPTNEIEKGLTW